MKTFFATDPSGVREMGETIESYCARHQLSSKLDREAVARRVMVYFANGNQTADTMLTALEIADAGASEFRTR